MTQPYYVEPEYWLEGYAEGDVTSAAAVMPIQSAVLASAVRIQHGIGQIDIAATIAAAANRVQSASGAINAASTVTAAANTHSVCLVLLSVLM
jgi:hypothetical protein